MRVSLFWWLLALNVHNSDMLKEFKEFIAKGNVLDLAVGIIIGAAFTGIVDSFVKDIISPIIGIFGKANFDSMFVVLKQGDVPGPYPTPDVAQKAGAVIMTYGAFLTHLVQFLIIAFVVFLIVKAANKFKSKQQETPASVAVPADITLLTEIRDLLAKKP
jgi:large conductance mechanosensitive channel